MSVCRFCGDFVGSADAVHYGVRHYAHPLCYLHSGKPLSAIRARWHITFIPARALTAAGRVEEADAVLRPWCQRLHQQRAYAEWRAEIVAAMPEACVAGEKTCKCQPSGREPLTGRLVS